MVSGGHSAWAKNRRREIRHTLGRYLAILAIVALGVGFFAGLKVTKGDMLVTGDEYISDHGMYDYRLISTLGLTADDAAYISGLDGVKLAEGAYTADLIADIQGKESPVIEAHSFSDNINTLSITDGRAPEATDECAADARYFSADDIGKTIIVSDKNDSDTASAFAYGEYKIVGLTDSVLYLNIERGTTKLADGKINAFIFIPPDGFALDYYTEIYVTLGSGGKIYSDAYNTAVDNMKTPLTDALETRGEVRMQDLKDEAYGKIADAQSEYDASLADYNEQKGNTERELTDAKQQLDDASAQLSQQEQTINDSAAQLEKSKNDYTSGLDAYNQAQAQYAEAKASSESQLADARAQLDANRAALEASFAAAQAAGDTAQTAAINAQLAALDTAQTQLNDKKAQAEAQFKDTAGELAQTKAKLDASAAAISDAESAVESGLRALDEGKAEYKQELAAYDDSKTQAESQFAEAEAKLADAKAEIDDATAKADAIGPPDVYVLDRSVNTGYSSFENDSSIVEGIAKVFPVFFFLVAALVCTTTMARMVEEQRSQIGTFKALGYGDGTVAWKYVSYSASAALIGCVIGYFGGTRLFPYVIWKAYGMLYGFAPLSFADDWWLFALSIIVSLACSAGVTFVTCRAELTLMPAELMRPKAPKPGKRVLLERVKFIWNRLNFLQKVSIRNIFRYKKRLFMMALGIGGCTALLLAGFGIRDSISNIAADQYGEIMKYDLAVSFGGGRTSDGISGFADETKDFISDSVFICAGTVELPTGRGVKTANVIATDDPEITKMIDMHGDDGAVAYPPDGSVAVSNKLASLAGVKVGDKITLLLNDGSEREVAVSGVFENHAYHYILMTSATYESIFSKACEYSDALATVGDGDAHKAAAKLINDFGAVSVTVTNDIRTHVENMMRSLNYIVYVVIAGAAALAFVVLFNLSNINITERVREIATIKVLGFYAPEVGAYVFRENIALTAIGAAAGVPLGIWLHMFVMGQINIDMVSFTVRILPTSFLLAIAVTFVFDIIVDLLMRRKLSAINMVESLKSVE